jgi:hypothetical protein
MSYYKKLILDDNNFNEFIDDKFYSSYNEKHYFFDYISVIKGIINEETTQIDSQKKITIDNFFEKIHNKNNGKLLYFLSGKEPNPSVETLINDFYPNEDIYNILWGIGAYHKNLKIVSNIDILYHIKFFESCYKELSQLIKKNDKSSKILFTTIKNLLIETSYRANHLEFHKKEIVENNDSFNKLIQKLFVKCEIISFFKCIDCKNDLISIHKSYGDGLCSICGKKYEEKLLSVESNIITGGEVDDETLNEIIVNRPHLLLNYPYKGKRVPVFIRESDYEILEGDKNSYSNITKTSIILNNNILDSKLKIKDEIVENNKKYYNEYHYTVSELKKYESSYLINTIGTKLLNILHEKSIHNRIQYDNENYQNCDSGQVNYYDQIINNLQKYNLFEIVITYYENREIMISDKKKKFTDLLSEEKLNSSEIFSSNSCSYNKLNQSCVLPFSSNLEEIKNHKDDNLSDFDEAL